MRRSRLRKHSDKADMDSMMKGSGRMVEQENKRQKKW